MKYYCDTISVPLAEKLKEKGMLSLLLVGAVMPTYAEVFDFFIEKEIYVNAYPEKVPAVTREYMYAYRPYVNGQIGKESESTFSWHEAAEKAIEKALTLI